METAAKAGEGHGLQGIGAHEDAALTSPGVERRWIFLEKCEKVCSGLLSARPPSAALLRQSTRFTAGHASVLNSWRLRSPFSQSLESRKLCGRCSVSRSRCMAPYSPTWDPGMSIQARHQHRHAAVLELDDSASEELLDIRSRQASLGIRACDPNAFFSDPPQAPGVSQLFRGLRAQALPINRVEQGNSYKQVSTARQS